MENRRSNLPGETAAPEKYERRDANIRALLKFGLSLLILIVVVLFGMYGAFNYFSKVETLGPPASPFENVRVLPPSPRLQIEPRADLRSYCESQKQELESYGWVDKQDGVVRIPVDRAMDLILERGLPARPSNGTPVNKTSSVSDETAQLPKPMGTLGPCAYLTEQTLRGPKE
jgi:hypothetical protein